LYVDDDSVDASPIRLLHRDGHNIQVPADAGLAGSTDQVHLAHAIRERRAVLTRNYKDFEALHDLVISAANGHRAGVLVVRYDNNPRNNMSSGDIGRVAENLYWRPNPQGHSEHRVDLRWSLGEIGCRAGEPAGRPLRCDPALGRPYTPGLSTCRVCETHRPRRASQRVGMFHTPYSYVH
jgi:hypothetical protein